MRRQETQLEGVVMVPGERWQGTDKGGRANQ